MRSLVTWLLDGLPFDPRSRRALDETLLDWAHEEAAESSALSRGFVQVVGAVSISALIVWSAGREVPDVPLGWFAWRTVRFTIILSAPLCAVLMWPLRSGFGLLHAVGILATFLPSVGLTVVAPALVLVMAWRPGDRRMPPAGVALMTAIALPLLTAGFLPLSLWAASEMYIRAMAASLGTELPGLREHMSFELGALVSLAGGRIAVAIGLTGLGATAGASVWFGAASATRAHLRSMMWLAVYQSATWRSRRRVRR